MQLTLVKDSLVTSQAGAENVCSSSIEPRRLRNEPAPRLPSIKMEYPSMPFSLGDFGGGTYRLSLSGPGRLESLVSSTLAFGSITLNWDDGRREIIPLFKKDFAMQDISLDEPNYGALIFGTIKNRGYFLLIRIAPQLIGG